MILQSFVYTLNTFTNAWYSDIPYNDGNSFGNTREELNYIAWRSGNNVGFWSPDYEHDFTGWYIRLGSSATPEVYASGRIIEPITTLTNINVSGTPADGNVLRALTGTFRNDTSDSIVVREIGIGICCNGFSSPYRGGQVILARKVLETPVVIAPGETYSFSYAIKVPH